MQTASLTDVRQAMNDAFLPADKVPIPFTPLTAAEIDPKAVNTVIISHFHGDHINGLRGKDGSRYDVAPTFWTPTL